ncbi:receptor-like protein kinase FERONIA [Gastrolobium bilobum]|uniref:receptor-like protein kinase FERONIA n=1 Tax=Gastrolobium bilobum TaxID=150636 RepID=UPI002AAFF275|nr:receptor-like protein kinase FERONIA [Gastrolobium bilobum]
MQLLANQKKPRTKKKKNLLFIFFNKHSYPNMVNFRKNKAPFEINLSLLFFLLQLQLLFILQAYSYNYNPADNFAVNCGNSRNISFQNRKWVGDDVDTKPFSIIESQTSQSLNAPNPPTSVPFGSARISHSKFTYSFPVTNGPKFIRLHFYPTSYLNFEPNNSLFSVIVGSDLTLLKDFKPLLWVHNNPDDNKITKEYCINVEKGESLNITFIPSTNHSNAYAFINGIEVVSMPTHLYYSDPNVDDPNLEVKLVGPDNYTPHPIQNSKALETLYRVNVGDPQVPPSNDTGMFRNWDNDYPLYLEKQYGQTVSSGYGITPIYKDNVTPNYTAPSEVYLTARSYGKGATENYNVTWNFEVDSEFTYMVRLHFCEFDKLIQSYGDRTFQIFIDDTLAEEKADVIGWSGGYLVPVRKDYAVLMSKHGSTEKVNLSIKLQRLPEGEGNTKYVDVILNGIEVFKISDENNNLAGTNPEPTTLSPPPGQVVQTESSKKSKKTIVVIIAAVAISSLVIVFVVIGFLVLRGRKRGGDVDENENSSWKRKNEGSSLPSHLCRYFTIAEIRASTNNFDDVFLIGVGGFGNVYKGYIDGSTPVAIKRLKQGSQQGFNEFMNEIEMLSQLRHLHLVSLIGYCNDGAEMILVYDFMQRGTLREYLYDSDNDPLPWKQRLEILLGAARGLHYLHAGAKHNIIHRDVKTTNILLDEKWVAKVSDFGLSKVGPTGMSNTHVSTIVKGSLGYFDPEYCKRQRLTLKSDVYSFGVVLLEVLCARPPLIRRLEKQKASLVDWVRRCYDKGEIDQTVDPFLKDSITDECLKCYSQMALSCLLDDGNQRPSMSDVVGALEFAMQLVETDQEDNEFSGTQEVGKSEQGPLLTKFLSDEGSDVRFTSSDESVSKSSNATAVSASTEEQALVSATVFSEIANPRAR